MLLHVEAASDASFIIAVSACAINEQLSRKLDCAREEARVLKEALAAI